MRVSHTIQCYYLPINANKPSRDEDLKYVAGYIGTETKFVVCALPDAFRPKLAKFDSIIEPKPMGIINRVSCLALRTLAKCSLRLDRTVFHRTDSILKTQLSYKPILNDYFSHIDYLVYGRLTNRLKEDFARLSVSSETHSYFPVCHQTVSLSSKPTSSQYKQ